MKLEKFKERKNQKVKLSITIIVCIVTFALGFLLNKTFSSFQETKKFNVIEGTVKYEGTGDVYVAAYIDGVKTNTFPSKIDYTYDEEQSNCTNEAVLNFDIVSWIGSVSNVIQPNTKCNLYFITRPKYDNQIYQMMVRLEQEDNTQLAYDGTKGESDLRYIGANPNNYVTFNGEQWRIIGSFNNIDDGTGKLEWRTKIIKTVSIGNKAWDISVSGINKGLGINEWSQADIKDELNGTYLNNLSKNAQDMIGDTVWNIGSNENATTWNNVLTSKFYEYERSNYTSKICSGSLDCNDTVERTTVWTGKIGLMYPSDYGYAVGGSNRTTCLSKNLYDWSNNSNCYNNDWLFNNGNQWLMTPSASPSFNNLVFRIASGGRVDRYGANNTYGIRPALYLSSNVQISGGSGTSDDPYILTV